MKAIAKNGLQGLAVGLLPSLLVMGSAWAQVPVPEETNPVQAAVSAPADDGSRMPEGDPERGRLIFGQCRTCHYPEPEMGHNNGPNLHRIFGKVAGKQEGFEYYSETFREAQFVWTPELLWLWLADPLAMFPDTSMMARGIADPHDRADLVAYLMRASVRGVAPEDDPAPAVGASPDSNTHADLNTDTETRP